MGMPQFGEKIRDCLKLPETKNIESIDSPQVTELRSKIIWEKPFLRRLYTDFYQEFKNVSSRYNGGVLVELGSGGGFLKTVIPHVVTSDILSLSGIDLNYSGMRMPFKERSLDAFFMLNVLHHIPDALVFLKEMERCLKAGGRIVMIEPANTLWARFIYQNFHHEPFDPSGDWTVKGDGPLTAANGAIPWIIFSRDRKKFEEQFPSLQIRKITIHTPFRYLISGGVSMRSLLPSFCYHLIKGIEIVLSPLNPFLGMFYTIDIEKLTE